MPLRVAGLGAGYFSGFHYDAWQRLDDAVLVGAADTDLAKAVATGAPAFETLGEMLAATRPDLLSNS
jgi:predicted dehydrogenase